MSVQQLEPIILRPLTAWEQAQKTRAKLPAPLRILTSLKTTAVLGAILGTLVAPAASGRLALGAVKGVGRFVAKRPLASVLGAGALIASPKLRKDVVALPEKALKAGGKLGEIYEEPGKAKDILGIKEKMTGKEKVIAGAKVAGVGGALIAGGIAAKTLLEKRRMAKELDIAKAPEQISGGLKTLGFTEAQPVGLGGIPIKKAIPTPTGAPGATKTQPAVSNIIQIQLM